MYFLPSNKNKTCKLRIEDKHNMLDSFCSHFRLTGLYFSFDKFPADFCIIIKNTPFTFAMLAFIILKKMKSVPLNCTFFSLCPSMLMFFRFTDRQLPVFPYSIFIELLDGKVGCNEQETSKKRISIRHDHQQNLFSNRQPACCNRVFRALLSLPLLYEDMRCNGNVSYLYGPAKTTNIQHETVNFCCWCPSRSLFHEMTRETNKNSHCSEHHTSSYIPSNPQQLF